MCVCVRIGGGGGGAYVEDLIDVLTGRLIVDWWRSVPTEHVVNGAGHAGHFCFADVAVAVEVVKTENPAQLLLHCSSRGLR